MKVRRSKGGREGGREEGSEWLAWRCHVWLPHFLPPSFILPAAAPPVCVADGLIDSRTDGRSVGRSDADGRSEGGSGVAGRETRRFPDGRRTQGRDCVRFYPSRGHSSAKGIMDEDNEYDNDTAFDDFISQLGNGPVPSHGLHYVPVLLSHGCGNLLCSPEIARAVEMFSSSLFYSQNGSVL